MFRTTRAPAAFVVLMGLLLGLLVCGASAGAPATPPDVPVLGAAVPGCDPLHPVDEGAVSPVVPPRAHGFADLLSTLAGDRASCRGRQPEPVGRALPPGREAPARVPPSPVELSVLRV
ncbi:hypothetical protein [Streptomyces sp. NPDC058872]|uniref:hypothetical protein n=1 Tax=Streptomyces sp. NPDC058872 TaxID=3346661 RepID=UPI003687F27C